MWWSLKALKVNDSNCKVNHTIIPKLLTKLQIELDTSLQIQPFDKVFDEDSLSSNYEKIHMLDRSIEHILNTTPIDFDVMYRFIELKQQTEKDIEDILLQRAIRYAEWKKEVMILTERQLEVMDTIKELKHIDTSIQRLLSSRPKVDIMFATMFHHMINTLLKVAGYDKQNIPYLAFTTAFNKGLIDMKVCKRLITYYK